jgi:hypothetical protein
MQLLNHIRQLCDALITALAVVFGLQPDPTRVPVETEPLTAGAETHRFRKHA